MFLKNREQSGKRITKRFLKFKNMEEIGCGTFGVVYKSAYYDKEYAIKKYTYNNDPLHTTTIREIKAMRSINSRYVLQILEIIVERDQLFVVFDFFHYDLCKFLSKNSLKFSEIKTLIWQILKGVQDIHNAGFLHRDLKPSNILLSIHDNKSENDNDNPWKNDSRDRFCIKICDFGMSKISMKDFMTPGVATLWYRAPELLLGSTNYHRSVDVWSVGCIFAELLLQKPLFSGSNEIEQLENIISYCGSINSTTMSGFSTYPNSSKYYLPENNVNLKSKLSNRIQEKTLDLLEKLLILDPHKRITIEDALIHPFFHSREKSFKAN